MRYLALVLLFAASLSMGATEKWEIDSSHSTARFKVKHMMVTNVSGEVGGVEGEITLDGDDMTKMTVTAKADMKTISTNNAKRDEHLRGDDFFSTKKFPTASFKSKKVAKDGDKYKITGDLTLHGVTKEVVLDSEGVTPAIKDPWGAMRRGFSATGKIDRKEFGVSYGKVLDNGGAMVANEVELNIECEVKNEAAPAAKTAPKKKG